MRMLRSEGMLDGGCQLLGLYGVPALVPWYWVTIVRSPTQDTGESIQRFLVVHVRRYAGFVRLVTCW